jgi:hypothetical protein
VHGAFGREECTINEGDPQFFQRIPKVPDERDKVELVPGTGNGECFHHGTFNDFIRDLKV